MWKKCESTPAKYEGGPDNVICEKNMRGEAASFSKFSRGCCPPSKETIWEEQTKQMKQNK